MKRNNKSSLALAILAASLTAGTAQAADSGFFAEVGAGYMKADPDLPSEVKVDDDSMSFSVGVGYNINQMFAIEGGYVDLGEVKASYGVLSAKVSADGFYFGPRLTFALSDKVDAYGRIGMIAWDAETSSNFGVSYKDDGTDVYFGIGAAYKLSDKVALAADWTRYKYEGDGADVDVDVIAAKLKLNF